MAAAEIESHMDLHSITIKQFINSYFESDSPLEKVDIVEKIIGKISSSTSGNLVNLVELLSFSLTDLEVESRLKGTSLLAELMHKYESGAMVKEETKTFISFFAERLRDHHSIQPVCIYGFLGLTSFQNVSNELVTKMLRALFAEVHVQSLLQADRRNVFNLFNNLLKLKIDVIKEISADFLLGFIQSMEGESDPRNLLVCFENSKLVIDKLDITLFNEEFFEILSCYFPVEFTPPKNNEFHITKSDLVLALRSCLTGTDQFAPYAIPLYIEKLSSDLADSKKDALITFTMCLDLCKPSVVEPFITDIWLLIRKDYLLSETTDEIDDLYLEFVSKLILCLKKGPDCVDSLKRVIDLFIKDCLQTLKDPELTIAKQCSNLIFCVSNISNDIYNTLCSALIPVIEKSFERYTSNLQQEHMLYMIVKLLAVSPPSMQDTPSLLIEFIDKFLSHVYEVLNSLEDNDSLKILSLDIVKEIVDKKDAFTYVDFHVLLEHVLTLLFSKVLKNQSVTTAFKESLSTYIEKFPDQFYAKYVSKLECLDLQSNEEIYSQCVDVLQVCLGKLALRVIDYLSNILTKNECYYTDNVILCHINTINSILKHCHHKCMEIEFVITKCSVYLFTKTEINEPVLNSIALTLSYSCRRLDKLKYKVLLEKSCNLLFSDNIKETLAELYNISEVNISFVYSRVLLHCAAVISQCEVTALKPDAVTVSERCWAVANKIQLLDGDDSSEYAAICASSVLNKVEKDTVFNYILSLVDEIRSMTTTPSTSRLRYSTLVNFTVWITKGSVLNWQKSTPNLILLLLDMLCSEHTGKLASSKFENLFSQNETLFEKKAHCNVSLMYKQRFTQFALPLMIERYHRGDEQVKANMMIAISCTLKIVPTKILNNYLTSLVPLLMQSLSSSKSSLILNSTLATVLSVLAINKAFIEEYITSLVPRFLQICTHEKMNIRILSVKCLSILSTYPSFLIVPMQSQVIKELQVLLDDRKRLVRKEAVTCSNAWHLLNS